MGLKRWLTILRSDSGSVLAVLAWARIRPSVLMTSGAESALIMAILGRIVLLLLLKNRRSGYRNGKLIKEKPWTLGQLAQISALPFHLPPNRLLRQCFLSHLRHHWRHRHPHLHLTQSPWPTSSSILLHGYHGAITSSTAAPRGYLGPSTSLRKIRRPNISRSTWRWWSLCSHLGL